MITIKEYVRAESLEQAYTLNQKKRNRIIGGMLWLKMGKGAIDTAIDLCGLGLDKIEETEDTFVIGAMTTLRSLETHEGLNSYTNGSVKRALENIVGVQFRNLATIGGSLWGRYGFSDVLTFLMSLDCQVELYKGGLVPVEQFASMKHDRDIIVRIIIRKAAGRFGYSDMRIQSTDFPALNCAVSYFDGMWRCAVGARPSRAVLVKDEGRMLPEKPDPEQAETFAKTVAEQVTFGSNMRGSARYRKHLAEVLLSRLFTEIGGNLS
ncbi:MAG: FAD binding domain-containing protein [Oscillospiraceae bacterium]|nr:FAD binding domain-containing protein [Oscillospiraceae bacterium]